MILVLLVAVNLTTGQEISPFSVAPIATEDHDAGASDKAGGVLWDYTHGIYLNYSLEG